MNKIVLELEETIMGEIGLGMPYSWHNGSGSCIHTREEAAKRLPEAITKHNAIDNSKIAPPQAVLTELVARAGRLDKSEYVLTKTWQVASDVIRAHMNLASVPKEKLAARVAAARDVLLGVYFGESLTRDLYPWDRKTNLAAPARGEEE